MNGRDASDSNGSGSARRVLRAELIIAALALITSACASIAAIFQTHEAIVQTNETRAQTDTLVRQLGTSIWPYLTMGYSYVSTPGTVVYTVTNEGLGPALIRSFSISLDGRRVEDAGAVLRLIDSNPRANFDENDFGSGLYHVHIQQIKDNLEGPAEPYAILN